MESALPAASRNVNVAIDQARDEHAAFRVDDPALYPHRRLEAPTDRHHPLCRYKNIAFSQRMRRVRVRVPDHQHVIVSFRERRKKTARGLQAA
jgi:hypothetical protein